MAPGRRGPGGPRVRHRVPVAVAAADDCSPPGSRSPRPRSAWSRSVTSPARPRCPAASGWDSAAARCLSRWPPSATCSSSRRMTPACRPSTSGRCRPGWRSGTCSSPGRCRPRSPPRRSSPSPTRPAPARRAVLPGARAEADRPARPAPGGHRLLNLLGTTRKRSFHWPGWRGRCAGCGACRLEASGLPKRGIAVARRRPRT